MKPPPSKSVPEEKGATPDVGRRATLWVSAAFVAVGVFLLAFPEGHRMAAVERLEKDPLRAAEWQVTGNTVHRINITRLDLEVTATPVRGGRATTLFRTTRSNWTVLDARVVGGEAWILVRPVRLRDGSQLGNTLNMDSAPDTKRTFGDYLPRFEGNEYQPPDGTALTAKETRRARTVAYFEGQERPTLYRVALRDGSVRTTQIDVGGYVLDNIARCLTPTGLYWVRPGARQVTDVIRADGGSHVERAASDAVLLSPLDGGPPRELASGVSIPALLPCGEGACGRQPAPYPRTRRDLYRFTPDGATVVTNYDGFESPTEFGGRLYWVENRPGGGEESGPHVRVLSCARDGGDRRAVARVEGSSETPRFFVGVFAAGDGLYAVQTTRLPTRARNARSEGESRSEFRDDISLYRVNPDDPEPLGEPVRLPESVGYGKLHPVEGYLYFYLVERQNNPVDFLFERMTNRARVTLCRVTLPR
jgi:hypothetical protein